MYRLRKLPYLKNYISQDIYMYLSDANYALGELKGMLEHSPYLDIIRKILNVYESIDSSKLADNHLTLETFFKQSILRCKKDDHVIQVINHMRSINILYTDLISKNKLYKEDVNRIQAFITPDSPGIRHIRGHKVYNKVTSEVLYVPPQNKNAIHNYFDNLLDYINTNKDGFDPLIKMAIVHYQFESIRPYKDGNGRIGRILNIMTLIQYNRLNYPILNLSRYLNDTRVEYFYLLEKCHNNIQYLDEFIIYLVKGVIETTKFAITLTNHLTRIIRKANEDLLLKLPKIYSINLLHHLFLYPYTKNELFRTQLHLSRTTATKYLKLLEENNFIESYKHGKEVLYKNNALSELIK